MSGRGRSVGRIVAVVVAGALAVNAAILFLDGATGSPGGPPSSSFSTSARGFAAYAGLLASEGHRVVGRRADVAEGVAPGSTLVVLDVGGVTPAQARAIGRFVAAGGRLVAGGDAPGWLEKVLDDPPAWAEEPARAPRIVSPVPEVAEVADVRAAGTGVWTEAGSSLPIVDAANGALVGVAEQGRGRIVLLADSSPLQNAWLDEADNAALGLGIAGAPGRPVIFAESLHGYGEATGLGALPGRWRWALAGLVLAAAVLMVAKGRRLGPPEEEARALPPPRHAYAESLAGILARTRAPAEALEPVQRAARERIAATAGLPPNAPDDAVRAAAARAGLLDDEVRSLFEPARAPAEVMAAGRALARASEGNARLRSRGAP